MRRVLNSTTFLMLMVPAVAGSQAAPTPGAEAAARELLSMINIEEVMRASAQATFNAQVNAQPELAAFRDIIEGWTEKYMSLEHMGPQLARIYTESFSEAELRQLIAFYRTPLGRKLAAATPELSRKGAQAGAEIAARHGAELERLIQARAAEMQRSPNQP